MSELFRLAVAAAAGYAVQHQASKVQSTNAAGETARLSIMGRLVIGAGVALAVWVAYPTLTGQKGAISGADVPKLLSGSRPAPADASCGCPL